MTKPPKDIRTRARAHANLAIEKLVELVERDDVAVSTQLAAAKQLLELGYGRVPRDNEDDDEKRPIGERLRPHERKALQRKLIGEDALRARRAMMRRIGPNRSQRKQQERDRAHRRAMQAAAAGSDGSGAV